MGSDAWSQAVVVNRHAVAARIVVLDLVRTDGQPFAKFDAGAHIGARIGSNHLVRQYSLCPSEEGQYRIAVLRCDSSRGGSEAMHRLAVGDHLDVSEPRQLFGLADADRHVMLAGGIGITPLLSMAEELDAAGGEYSLHYVVRSSTEAAFLPDLEVNPRVTVHITGGIASNRPKPDALLGEPDQHTAVYVCGPNSFMEDVLRVATDMRWPRAALHTERFTPIDAMVGESSATEFDVKLASTGAKYLVPPDRSVLDVLRANGVRVSYSCEQGMCGECVVSVLSGDPDHRDHVLDDEERDEGAFAVCVSRSHGPTLELDI